MSPLDIFIPHILGTLGNCRTLEQYREMKRFLEEGKCPFCEPCSMANKPLRVGKHWVIKHNDFPYPAHAHHLVLFTREHITDIALLSPSAWAEWGEFNIWAIREYRLPGGGLVMRFGDPAYNAGTIIHPHSHIQVPDLTDDARATFAKSPERLAAARERVIRFEEELQKQD